mmetsp:Transcript_226/g.668  ORF Transcript_226/g.668 Transcript_226/m.668 type:complete len:355 (-) Transcript_226:272-1336(-)
MAPAIAETNCPQPSQPSMQEFYWKLGGAIGESSSVRKVMNVDACEVFAGKALLSSTAKSRSGEMHDAIVKEVQRWRCLRHQNLVRVHDLLPLFEGSFLQLELVPHGSLADFVEAFGPIQGRMLRDTTRAVLRGLEYLHTQSPSIVHGNLKASNVLHIGEGANVKLTDWWFSGCALEGARHLRWASPEVIVSKGCMREPASDVWSLGCTVIELATAECPWGVSVSDSTVKMALSLPLPTAPPVLDELPADLRDFLERCFLPHRCQRPTVVVLATHPFVTGLSLPLRRRTVAAPGIGDSFAGWRRDANVSSGTRLMAKSRRLNRSGCGTASVGCLGAVAAGPACGRRQHLPLAILA